jgi:membrane-associated phospholipid phosphatase
MIVKKIIVIVILGFSVFHTQANQPLFDTTDIRVFRTAGIATATAFAGAYFMDASVNNFFEENRKPFLNHYTSIANPLGDKWVILPANVLIYGGGLLLKDEKLEKTSLNALKSVLTTGILTEGSKQLFGRARPDLDKGPSFFDPFPIFRSNNSQYKSLPSGHASLAFAFFTPFAEAYSEWLYLIPASVAFSRVYKNKHWTSDVILGSAIGFAAGYFFQEKNRNIEVSFNKIVIKF